MKDASPQPAREEATPLFVGGAATTSKRRKKLPIVIIVTVVILAAVGYGLWWYFDQKANYLNLDRVTSQSVRVIEAKELAKKPVPQDAKERAAYYVTIATYLKIGREYIYAEHFMLTAQKVADENNLDKKEYRYYMGLSDIYKSLGNQKKADEYAQKEQQFLEANYSKEVLDQMKAAQPDEPHDN